jgi:histidinol-phosphate/aromatic aminotransferase/cobyric acid decarboxylase-like protein
VRLCDSFHGMPKGRFLRVAVRTAAENEQLTQALSAISGSNQQSVTSN